MTIKTMNVFYGVDNLPYKDVERQVHYPITGSAFMGASSTTEIRFYFERIGDQDTTWVSVAKLPNGKMGSKVLTTYTDSALGEKYAKLELTSFYTQAKGDVFISLQGYAGGIDYDYDEETELYTIHGTPTIQATGSIKIAINYATQVVGSGEESTITLQQVLALVGQKINKDSTFALKVIDDIDDVNESTFADYVGNGVVVFGIEQGKFYYLDGGSPYQATALPITNDYDTHTIRKYESLALANADLSNISNNQLVLINDGSWGYKLYYKSNNQLNSAKIENAYKAELSNGGKNLDTDYIYKSGSNQTISGGLYDGVYNSNFKYQTKIDVVASEALLETSLKGYADGVGTSTLTSANAYADTQDQTILNLAKGYTDSKVSSVYVAKGSVSSIPSLASQEIGWVYNVSVDFTTTSDFVEGAGINYPAGTNIVCIMVGVAKKWDVLAGSIDTTNFLQKDAETGNYNVDGADLEDIGSVLTNKTFTDEIATDSIECRTISEDSIEVKDNLDFKNVKTMINVVDPTNDQDVATKKYVDDHTPILPQNIAKTDTANTFTADQTFNTKVITGEIAPVSDDIVIGKNTGVVNFNSTIRPTANKDLGDSTYKWKDLYLSGQIKFANQYHNDIIELSGYNLVLGKDKYSTTVSSSIIPIVNGECNIGRSTDKWKDLYLSGELKLGSDCTIAQIGGNTMRINTSGGSVYVNGGFYPILDDTYNLGQNDNKWKNAYFSGNVSANNLMDKPTITANTTDTTYSGAIITNRTYTFSQALTSLAISSITVASGDTEQIAVICFTTSSSSFSLTIPNTLSWVGGTLQPILGQKYKLIIDNICGTISAEEIF